MHTLAQDAVDAFFSTTPMEPKDFLALGGIMVVMEPDEYAHVWADAMAIVAGQKVSPFAFLRYIDTVEARQERIRMVLNKMQTSTEQEQRVLLDLLRKEAAASIGLTS